MARHFMTDQQRDHLLRVYLMEGYEAAKPLAIKYGIKPNNISKIAARRGHYGNRDRRRYHDSKNDPRWERARAVGIVVV